MLVGVPVLLRWLRSSEAGLPKQKPVAKKPRPRAATKKAPATAAKRPSKAASPAKTTRRQSAPSPVADAARRRQSDVILEDAGVVVKILPDDQVGSRHQRFLLDIDESDVTVKVAHNLDLAPRVPVRAGQRLRFKGEYEWNELGGAIHWTHHDPKQWRPGGWIEVDGKRYE